MVNIKEIIKAYLDKDIETLTALISKSKKEHIQWSYKGIAWVCRELKKSGESEAKELLENIICANFDREIEFVIKNFYSKHEKDEDALLARTCAYYHDVGKLRRPEYFKENQPDGVNPHDDLTPELSANIIKSHTQDGHDLLVKSRIPKEIAEVCLQHHGTSPMIFFYDKAKKFTDGEVDVAQFCYPGPKPRTKVAAILMIADSAEAATRTLSNRSRENVTSVVRKLVSDRMKLGQFDDCEITLKELNIIIDTVINSLTGVYHRRVKYPKVTLDGLENEKE